MSNYYADLDCDLEKLLHGVARLHVHLGRKDKENISTRGWSYNDLITGVLDINSTLCIDMKQFRAVLTLFDTLDAMTEIGPRAVSYLKDLKQMG
jgi:hypothetical protein